MIHMIPTCRAQRVRDRGARVRVPLFLHTKVLDALPLPGARSRARGLRHARRAFRGMIGLQLPVYSGRGIYTLD